MIKPESAHCSGKVRHGSFRPALGGEFMAFSAQSSNAPASTPWQKIVLWTVLFQLAWFWRKIPLLMGEGAMPDTDDFQRLAQVRSWMAGQGWFDLVNHRMDPPTGADMHWSRLVDIPIAALTAFFDLFASTLVAERLTAIVWPTTLLVLTVLVVLAICRRLDPKANPLLALLFTVTCITALTEFMPGRIDHHGLQILLFCLMLLGLVAASARGALLTGAAIAASVSIGLDAIFIIAFLLGWAVIEWIAGKDGDGRRLTAMATGLAGAAIPLFLINIAPSQWLAPRCDANSAFYVAALLLAAASYVLLARFRAQAVLPRLGVAAATGVAALGVLLLLFPQCAGGPFADLPDDLKTRWLVNVGEARGLLSQLEAVPQLWLWGVGYSAVLLVAAGWLTWRNRKERPQMVALYAVLAISVLASLFQYRTLRIGIFASIPFCVILSEMAFAAIGERFRGGFLRGALQAGVVACLSSPVWLGAAVLLFPQEDPAGFAAPANASEPAAQAVSWRESEPAIFCNRQSDYATLAALDRGLVMSDINSGPSVVVFTQHDAIGGPYHRNGKAILDMLDFFETDLDNPRRIARERGIRYVAWCENIEPFGEEYRDSQALAVRIERGEEPQWLERISPPGDRLHLFRVTNP
jgi:hypothetical protein